MNYVDQLKVIGYALGISSVLLTMLWMGYIKPRVKELIELKAKDTREFAKDRVKELKDAADKDYYGMIAGVRLEGEINGVKTALKPLNEKVDKILTILTEKGKG